MSIQYTTEEQIKQMREELRKAKEKSGKKQKKTGDDQKICKRGSLLKTFFSIIFYGIIAFLLFLLASVLIAKNSGKVPSIFGYQLYVVESGSMSPTLKVGSVILSKAPKDSAALQVGDIVTFKSSRQTVVTHRIIEVITNDTGIVQYRTKGDNPVNSPDVDLLDPENILAVFILKIPLT